MSESYNDEQPRKQPHRTRGWLRFAGLEDQHPPDIVMELVLPSGKRHALDLSDDYAVELDPELVGEGARIEIRAREVGGPVRSYRYDAFYDAIQRDEQYVIPKPTWEAWWLHYICVTGKVIACRPIFPPFFERPLRAIPFQPLPIDPRRQPAIDIPHQLSETMLPWPFERCLPVCQGKVEVFVRVCCCDPIIIDPPVIIDDICRLLGCPEPWPPEPWPPEPWPPEPWPPGPGPGPDPGPWLERITQRALKRSAAIENALPAEDVLRLSAHLNRLVRLPREQQVAYIQANADLRWWPCHCSSNKVAEVALHPDGHFDACWTAPLLTLANCTYRVQYRVSQLQGMDWVVIYDGLARGESFAFNEEAVLRASATAETCQPAPDIPPGMTPFVMLEQIGNTWADNLIHSTQQIGETAFGGLLATTDGLVNPAPAGVTNPMAGPYDQPWGKTLSLRFQFHSGLAALGAKYYRVRVVRLGVSGQPLVAGPSFTLTNDVSWRKYYKKMDGSVGVRWISLSNPVINGVEGLYTIPYPDLTWPWLGGQWHAHVVTDQKIGGVPRMPNGRYVFVVDLFDSNGHRLVPNNSMEPIVVGENAAAFHYLRLDGPLDANYANTSVVPHSALANLFLVDNLTCYGDIEQIVHNGTPSMTNCQFLEGAGTDHLQLEYSAYHSNGFQWYHRIRFKQGLTGPVTWLPASNADVHSGWSAVQHFTDLLGAETKCAFAANLYVYARHTNGIGRIQDYDQYDQAAFALEILTP